jgi:hypothetical protein
MTEPTRLFQFETDAPYERLMLDRLASRETSQQMVKAVLGEDILRELGMSQAYRFTATQSRFMCTASKSVVTALLRSSFVSSFNDALLSPYFWL